MSKLLIVGHRGFAGSSIYEAARKQYCVEGISSNECEQIPRANYDLVINAGGRIWGDITVVRQALMSSARTAILHARSSHCPILHIGSAVEYGARSTPTLLAENDDLYPKSEYAEAKIRSWHWIKAEASHGAFSLRSSLILSPSISHQSLLGKVRNTALFNKDLFPVSPSILAMKRNPIHIQDFVSAVLAVTRCLLTDGTVRLPTVLNCGGDEALRVCDLANQVLTFVKFPFKYDCPTKTSQYELVSSRQLKSHTGWNPTHSIRNGDWLI